MLPFISISTTVPISHAKTLPHLSLVLVLKKVKRGLQVGGGRAGLGGKPVVDSAVLTFSEQI